MKVLVTGGAGFIGSHACERFLRDGHQVLAVDDLSTGKLENLADVLDQEPFRFTEMDIVAAEFREVVAAFRPDVVVHLAAQMDVRKSVADPLADARVNVLGTVQLLTAASQCGTERIVFASSGGTVYGEPDAVPVPETAPLRPLSPYGAAKVAGEAYVSAFARLYGMQYCTLVLGNVFGPRQDPHGEAGVVAIFARALLSGAPSRIFGGGTSIRDYVHVEDVVEALWRAAEGMGDGQRVNIGSGRGTSIRELHTTIARVVGARDEPDFAPVRLGELERIVLDVSAAQAAMGWSPRISLEEGLVGTVRWICDTRQGYRVESL